MMTVNLCLLSVAIISDYLSAHENLCDRGILHRDISPCNVMLTETQSAPLQIFIADLEFACIEIPTLLKLSQLMSIHRAHVMTEGMCIPEQSRRLARISLPNQR